MLIYKFDLKRKVSKGYGKVSKVIYIKKRMTKQLKAKT